MLERAPPARYSSGTEPLLVRELVVALRSEDPPVGPQVPKTVEIVGLYVNPPGNAVVLSVAESLPSRH